VLAQLGLLPKDALAQLELLHVGVPTPDDTPHWLVGEPSLSPWFVVKRESHLRRHLGSLPRVPHIA